MRLQKIQHQRPVSNSGIARKLIGLVKLILFIGLICFAGWMFLKNKVHNELLVHVQAKISDGLEGSGLVAKLGQARFHEGAGIQLNDLVVNLDPKMRPQSYDRHSVAYTPVSLFSRSKNPVGSTLEIYEAFLHAPVSMAELAAGEIEIQAVELRRAKITLVRQSDGSWDFTHILDTLKNLQSNQEDPIPVALRDCEIQIVDQRLMPEKPIRLTGMDVFVQPIVHEGQPLVQIHGGFHSPAISEIDFTAFLNNQTQTWNARVNAARAKLSRDLISILPPEIQSGFSNLDSISGVLNFNAEAIGSMRMDDIPQFSLRGNVQQFAIDDDRMPIPVSRTSADFFLNNHELKIINANGQAGEGKFTNCNYWQTGEIAGFLGRKTWHLDGSLDHFKIGHSPRLSRWLSMYCKRFCKEFSPRGTSNFEFDLTHDGVELKREIKTEITDMSFSYFKMPYRIDHCTGEVYCKDSFCNFEVKSVAGRQQCEFKGFLKGIGKAPTFEVTISVPGDVAIDQKLLDAVDAQPILAKVIRAFQPTGRVGGIGKIEKRIPGGKIEKTFDVRLKQCSIEHNNFHYPIHNVNGLIQAKNDHFTFSNLTGNNGRGKVTCNGFWNPIEGLVTRFWCESIPFNDQLRYALKPEIREIWNGFRPRGTLDFMRVDMTMPIGQKNIDLVVEAKMEKPKSTEQANYVSIHPTWFPYEINHLVGTVKIGKGKITLTNIEGKHHKTWIVCQGDGDYSDNAWSVKLKDMLVGSLKTDEDLLAAVPSSLAGPIRQLKIDGLLSVKGEFSIAGSNNGPKPSPPVPPEQIHLTNQFSPKPTIAKSSNDQSTTLAWNVRLDMNQAKMQVGFPIENVFGGVDLVGEYDGANATCQGELNIESLTVYDVQITNVRGPIWLDNFWSSAGVFAQRAANAKNPNNVSPFGVGTKPMRSLSGKMQDGKVLFDAQMRTGARGEFYLHATLEDGCLKKACRQFAPQLKNIEGHSFAAIQMSGDATGTHSHRGNGLIQLRDAKIYELPVFLSLLKILKVRQGDRTAFDSSDIEFQIQGENFDFTRMEFIGDAISLIGNGKMNLDWDIDLNFYSVVGRNRFHIPLLSELYKAGSQKILWINVNGKLDNPKTNRHVLPQLNDSLQQLFQPRQTRPGTRGLVNRFNQSVSQPLQSTSQWPSGSDGLRSRLSPVTFNSSASSAQPRSAQQAPTNQSAQGFWPSGSVAQPLFR